MPAVTGPTDVHANPSPVTLPPPGDVELAEADFRFLDPPEPGADARLAVTLQNHADRPTGPLTLVVATRWLQSFTILGTVPPCLDDRPVGDAERELRLWGTGARRAADLGAPRARVGRRGRGASGPRPSWATAARSGRRTPAPSRLAPDRARLAPSRSRSSGCGQRWCRSRGSRRRTSSGSFRGRRPSARATPSWSATCAARPATCSRGSTRSQPGDEVVAESRGLEYRFVVSEIDVRPYDDIQETQPTRRLG